MIYKPKIKVNGVEIEMGGGTSTSPFLSCAELSDVASKSGLEIGAAAASCLKVTVTNPHKASFDGDKVELYISEIDDGETTTKERIEAEVGDSSTTELIDTSEEIYTDEPDEEVGEPLTDDEITEIETYSNELEELQIKLFEGDPMPIVDIETAEEEDPEWELFGTFYVHSQTSSADSVILACYDNISRLNMQYSQAETPQTFAEHWQSIKAELAEYGILLDDFENTDATPLQFLPLTTMRDALSLLAGYAGGFLACAPDGSLGISFYGYAGEILIRDDLLSISDTSSGEIIVDAIECENAHGEIITAGGGGQAVRMSNYLVTPETLESVIVPLYRGTRYTGGVLSCPWSRELVAGEFIRVMTVEEYRNYLMLLNSEGDTKALRSSLGQVLIISSQTIKFGGTATTTVYSACDSETAKSQYTQAPLKKQIIQTDKKAEDAAHTATDFIAPQSTSTTDDGIKVFPRSEKDNPQNYVQINQQGMQIYKSGQRAASFGSEKISLGENSEQSVLEMCGGLASLSSEVTTDIAGNKTGYILLAPTEFAQSKDYPFRVGIASGKRDSSIYLGDAECEMGAYLTPRAASINYIQSAISGSSQFDLNEEYPEDGPHAYTGIGMYAGMGLTDGSEPGAGIGMDAHLDNATGKVKSTMDIYADDLTVDVKDAKFNGTININGIPIKGCHKIRTSETGAAGSYTYNSIGKYMHGGQTIYLEEKLSEQLNGIILAWSFYNGSAEDWGWNFTVIPKAWILDNPNYMGMSTFMAEKATVGNVGVKYLYIRDNGITGNDNNSKSGTGTSGIKYANNKFVLRYVYGF